MKKHSKLLLTVLVIVLCFSTVILAACNNDKPEEPTNKPVATGKMLNEIVSKISSSMSFGESFGADIQAAFVIDDKTAANKDVSYKLSAKGNANGKQDAKESDTDFVIELVKEEGQNKEILLGIAYESIENEPYFFFNILGSGYKKINGYSMAALYKMTQNSASAAAEGGFDINTIISSLIPILFGETGTVIDNVYTLEFDLAKTVSSILELKDTILFALGMSEENLNALIAQYLGGLSYVQNGETVNVSDVATLERFFRRGMSFKGNLVFNFDKANKFVNANASFDFSYHGEDKANYTLKVDKAEIGKVATAVDSFAGFALTKDERKVAEAFNLLNFSLNGTVVGFDDKGEVLHKYAIEVQSDVDAFELLNLLNGTDKANIVNTLKKLGYFHLEINEVNDDGDNILNIMTLHSKFDEGFAVVNIHAYKAALYEVGIGGVYDFDALIDVIGMLGEGSDEPAEPSEPSEPAEKPSTIDTIKNVINTVKEVLEYFTVEDIKENGVTVELSELIYMLCNKFGLELGTSTKLGIDGIINKNNSMNFKFQTPTFGTCTTVETSTIKCSIKTASDFGKVETDRENFIKEVVSLEGASLKVVQNDTNLNAALDATKVVLSKAFPMTGITLKGETVKTHGFIMGAKGLDVSKLGTQQVTLYIAVANDMLDFAKAFALGDMIPLSGVLKFDATIEVVEFNEDATITTDNVKGNLDSTILIGSKDDKALFDLIRKSTGFLGLNAPPTIVTIDGLGSFNIDKSFIRVFDAETNGKDVTADVVDGDKIAVAGTYYVQIVIGRYHVKCGVLKMESVVFERKDGKTEQESIALGGKFDLGEYKMISTSIDKEVVESDITPTFKIGSTAVTLEQAFDLVNGEYFLKKDLSYAGKNLTINLSAKTASGKATQTQTIEIPISAVEGYSVKGFNSIYFGSKLTASITVSDVVYNVVYNGTKWIAVAEDGSEKEIGVTFTWVAGGTVQLNANGVITNYPNNIKDRSPKVNYVITIDEYIYTGTFTAYELSASTISKQTVNTVLPNTAIGSIDKIYFVDTTDNEVKTLEFKYGATGYGIYIKGTDTKVFDVTVTVTKDNQPYTLTDGKFTETGKYTVTYSTTINGAEQTFSHSVTVK